jgi:hypothetical protein
MVRHRSNCLRHTFLVLLVFLGEYNLQPTRSITGTKTKIIDHHAELRAIDDETSEVLIKVVSFKWKPGQYLSEITHNGSSQIISFHNRK